LPAEYVSKKFLKFCQYLTKIWTYQWCRQFIDLWYSVPNFKTLLCKNAPTPSCSCWVFHEQLYVLYQKHTSCNPPWVGGWFGSWCSKWSGSTKSVSINEMYIMAQIKRHHFWFLFVVNEWIYEILIFFVSFERRRATDEMVYSFITLCQLLIVTQVSLHYSSFAELIIVFYLQTMC